MIPTIALDEICQDHNELLEVRANQENFGHDVERLERQGECFENQELQTLFKNMVAHHDTRYRKVDELFGFFWSDARSTFEQFGVVDKDASDDAATSVINDTLAEHEKVPGNKCFLSEFTTLDRTDRADPALAEKYKPQKK